MAINNTKLKDIVTRIKSEGVRHAIASGSADEVKSLIPRSAQMVHNETDSYIVFGDGRTSTPSLPLRITEFIRSGTEDPDVSVSVLWRRLNRWLVPGVVETILLSPLMFEKFRDSKPNNFSFMWGEEISIDSPFFEEWINAPDARNQFLRVRDPRRPDLGSVDKDSWVTVNGVYQLRDLGSRQGDTLQSHIHGLPGYNLAGLSAHCRWYQENHRIVNNVGYGTPTYTPVGGGFANETRPSNMCVFYVWKTHDQSITTSILGGLN